MNEDQPAFVSGMQQGLTSLMSTPFRMDVVFIQDDAYLLAWGFRCCTLDHEVIQDV